MTNSTKKVVFGVIAVIAILFVMGFRVGHAHDGLKNALGSAQSGLIIYKNVPSLVVGSKVLVKMEAPEKSPLLQQLEVEYDERGNIKRDEEFATNVEGVFVAGDAGRGQSLIVWAIAEGRSAASAVDKYLMGESALPAPIEPTSRPLTV